MLYLFKHWGECQRRDKLTSKNLLIASISPSACRLPSTACQHRDHDTSLSIGELTHRDNALEGIISLVSLLELCHAISTTSSQENMWTHNFKVVHEKFGRSSSRTIVHLLTIEKVYNVLVSGFVENEMLGVRVARFVFTCTHCIPVEDEENEYRDNDWSVYAHHRYTDRG